MSSIIAPINIPSSNMIPHFFSDEAPITSFSSHPMLISSGSITPEPSIEFSNYDVLLMTYEQNEPICFAPGNHVGNQRFRVLLSIYRQRYLQANERGDEEECSRIAREVVDTVHKVVPNGRFFEQGRDNQWQELQLGPSTIDMIKSSLKCEPKDGIEERSPKRFCRRSSVVSVSSSEDDCCISTPSTFDVICDARGQQVDQACQHTGNNRLKVMLNIRMQKYKQSKLAGKRAIAEEVVSSIIDDASSQFLQSHKASGTYRPISREMAATCVKKAFDAAARGEKKKFGDAEVKKLMDRKKKKQLLGRIERQKGKKCVESAQRIFSVVPTTFKAMQPLVAHNATAI